MPIGSHIARCHHCLKEWMVGDCIPSTCDECEANGHRGMFIDCPVCQREFAERRTRIDAEIAKQQAKCQRCDGDGKAHGSDRPFEWSGPGTYPGPCPVCKGSGLSVPTQTPA